MKTTIMMKKKLLERPVRLESQNPLFITLKLQAYQLFFLTAPSQLHPHPHPPSHTQGPFLKQMCWRKARKRKITWLRRYQRASSTTLYEMPKCATSTHQKI